MEKTLTPKEFKKVMKIFPGQQRLRIELEGLLQAVIIPILRIRWKEEMGI